MKILHVTPSYKPAYVYGGPTMSISELCQTLIASGAEVTVYTTTANGKNELDIEKKKIVDVEKVAVIYFPRITKDHSHFSPSLLWKVFKTCKTFDAVHIHSWWNMVAIGAVFLCWLKGVKPILSPRGMLSGYSFMHQKAGIKQFFHFFLGRFLLTKTILHATAKSEEEECKRIYPVWPSFTLPNFVRLLPSMVKYQQSKDRSNGLYILGFLSRIDRKKGLELLLQALSEFSQPFELIIAGSGEDNYIEELKALCRKLNVADHVRWTGWLEGDAKFDFLQKIDLLVLTSFNENFANVVVESLSVGTPVLLSDKVGLSDFVMEYKMGWVTALNAHDIRSAIITSKNAIQERSFIHQEASSIVLNNFTGKSLANKYLDHYYNFTHLK